jgi:hypothetical protein
MKVTHVNHKDEAAHWKHKFERLDKENYELFKTHVEFEAEANRQIREKEEHITHLECALLEAQEVLRSLSGGSPCDDQPDLDTDIGKAISFITPMSHPSALHDAFMAGVSDAANSFDDAYTKNLWDEC